MLHQERRLEAGEAGRPSCFYQLFEGNNTTGLPRTRIRSSCSLHDLERGATKIIQAERLDSRQQKYDKTRENRPLRYEPVSYNESAAMTNPTAAATPPDVIAMVIAPDDSEPGLDNWIDLRSTPAFLHADS